MLVEVRKYPDVQIVVERMDCGKYQSSRRQVFYDKIMRKYKNAKVYN